MKLPRLIADIGGTNARFALVVDGRIEQMRVLPAKEHADFCSAANAFLSTCASGCRAAEVAMAIAAPIKGDAITMTNVGWSFSLAETRKRLGVERVIALNDFTALAMALRHLPRGDLRQLGGEEPVNGAPLALIGPGTGLGVSGLIPSGGRWAPLQGEGGHATLAAASDRESQVIALLRRRFTHVSAERVISGPGLALLYESLCSLDGIPATPRGPEQIAQLATRGADAHLAEALQLFCGWLGSVAGNLALTLGALGGVYIGGGIVPGLGDYFKQSGFRDRFEDKGRYRAYLAPIPVYVIHTALPAFIGLQHAFDDPGPAIVVGA